MLLITKGFDVKPKIKMRKKNNSSIEKFLKLLFHFPPTSLFPPFGLNQYLQFFTPFKMSTTRI